MPIVAIVAGNLPAGQSITTGLVLGGLITLVGVYVGALRAARPPAGAPAPRASA